MDVTLKLVYYILSFNAIIVFLVVLFYLLIGRRQRITVDFEEYLASLPRDAKIDDPYILLDGKWVKSNQAPQINSPSP
jgi:hypothetical protein